MRTVAILSQKGGTGKTTISLHLAVAAQRDGQTAVVIDLDPQASSAGWKDSRQGEEPVVVSIPASRLPQALQAAVSGGADLAIIDTAPHSETAALDAAKAADVILIPCRASYIYLKAVSTSVDIVNLAKRPRAMFVLSCVRPGDKSLPDEAEQALKEYGIPVAPQRITLRSDCVHALTAGQTIIEYAPDGAAAQEIHELFKLSFHQDGKMNSHQAKRESVTA
jgi:chromosome partitioning protein